MQQRSSDLAYVADHVGAITFLGVLADVIPAVLGLAAIGWYILRFVNWYRVNKQGKETWKGM